MILSWRKHKHICSVAVLATLSFMIPGFAAAESIGANLEAALYTMVVTIFGWLVYIGGSILNAGLDYFVFKFADNYEFAFGFAIDYLWSVMRDILNLTFIFGLIYIGFRLIFDAEDSRARHALVMLIGAALLVNFSLFFTKVVIDFSNATSFEIAKGITVLGGSITNTSSDTGLGGVSDVADQFMQVLGIQSVFSLDNNYDNALKQLEQYSGGGAIAYIFGIMIFFFVAAFVFAAGGILLIIRFVSLCIYMVFSPLMVLGMIIPFFKNVSRKWMRGFLGQAFVAPAYIFMLYLSLFILSSLSNTDAFSEAKLNDAFSVEGAAAGISTSTGNIGPLAAVLFFAVAIGFLIASLIVAKKISAVGADAAVSVGNNLRQRGQRVMGSATAGAGAAGLRSTVGRVGNKYANDENLKDKAATSWSARQALKLANISSKSSFDARQVAGAGKTAGVGEGKKGGYAARVAAAQKQEDEFRKLLGQVDDDDVRVMAQKNEVKNLEQEVREKRAAMQAEDNAGAKALLSNELAGLEEKLDKQKDKVEQEKNRRILGTSITPERIQSDIDTQSQLIRDAEDDIRLSVDDYLSATTDQDRAAIESTVKNLQKQVDDAKNEQIRIRRNAGVDTGYADTVEQRGWFTSKITGRNRGINRTVGKKLRKDNSKRIKGSSRNGGPAPATPPPTPPTP